MSAPPDPVDTLVEMMARLPGLGPRSARRVVLHLLRRRGQQMAPLAAALAEAAETVRDCVRCGNIATEDECAICRDPRRADATLCVVADVADLWALERSGAYRGRYHVLGGTLSALDDVGPEDLGLPRLARRVAEEGTQEVILALGATLEGQTTAHYIADMLGGQVTVTSLAQGVPVGGELDYLDDGTIGAALRSRRAF